MSKDDMTVSPFAYGVVLVGWKMTNCIPGVEFLESFFTHSKTIY